MRFFNFFSKKSKKVLKKDKIKPKIALIDSIIEEKVPIIVKRKHNLVSLSKKSIIKLFGKWITAGAEKCRICDVPLVKNNPRQIVYFCNKTCRRKRININY